MIYSIDDPGTHTLMQHNFCVGLFESHIKEVNDPNFEKIPTVIQKLKDHHKYTQPTLYIVRDEPTVLCDVYKELCAESKDKNLVLVSVDWKKSKSAGVDSMVEMLEHCNMSICIHDGVNKLEKIYMSKINLFTTISYVIYTGVNSTHEHHI